MNIITAIPRLIVCHFQFVTADAPFQGNTSLQGKTAVVTGGNSGIGFETAAGFAKRGANVVILCRDQTKAADAVQAINNICKESAGCTGTCTSKELDLSDLKSVNTCAKGLRDSFKNKKIDYFICNGGIMAKPYSVSPQGYEIHFATNHLGHFALIGGVLDILRASKARVIVVTGDIAVLEDDCTPDFKYEGEGLYAYCRSKTGNQSMAIDLAKKYPELTVISVHPGIIDSNLLPAEQGSAMKYFKQTVFLSNERGAQSTLLCALTDKAKSGEYFHNVMGICDPFPVVKNEKWRKTLWDTSVELVKKESNFNLYF